MRLKLLSLAAALLLAPALPTTAATTFPRQTIDPHSALPTPSSPYPLNSSKLRIPHSALRTLLAQATDPRQAEADQLLQQGLEQYKAEQYTAAIQTWQQALIRYRQLGNRPQESLTLYRLGLAHRELKHYDQAIAYFQQSLAIDQELKDREGQAAILYQLGMAHRQLEHYDQAIDSLNQSLTIVRDLKDREGEAETLYQLGRLYRLTRDYDQADRVLNQALAHFRGVKDRDGENLTLFELGLTYSALKQYDLALRVLEQSLAIDREQQNRDNELATLETIAQVYDQMGQPDKAAATRQQAAAISLTPASPTTTDPRKAEAERLLQQGIQQYQTSQYEAALQSWEQAFALYRTLQDRNGEANALTNLGVAYKSLFQYERAISYYQQALSIFQAVKDRNGEADALGNLGNAYLSLSQYEQAISYYQQALPIFQAAKDRNREARVLNNLGSAYGSLSQYERAIDYYQQALPIYQAVKDRNGEAKALTGLGVAYGFLSRYERAIGYYQQALPIYQAVKDRNGEAKALMNLGIAYGSLSQYERAIGYYQKSLLLFQAVQDRNGEALALTNLGNANASLSQHERAISYYQQALPILQVVKDRNGEARALMNLGIAYGSLSQHERAIGYYQKSLLLFQAVQDRNGEALALTNLGNANASLSQHERAISYYQQALPIYQAVKDRNGEASALNNWGLDLYETGKFAEAESRLYASIVLKESIRADLSSDQNKVSIFEEQAHSYRILQKVLIAQGKVEQALEVAERGRARAFVELLAGRLQGSPPTPLSKGGFKPSLQNPPYQGGQGGSNSLLAQTPSPTVKPIAIAEIKQIAKEQNATLVEYSLIYDKKKGDALYIWVVKPTGQLTFRQVDLNALPRSLAKDIEETRISLGIDAVKDKRSLTASNRAAPSFVEGDRVKLTEDLEFPDYPPRVVVAVNQPAQTLKLTNPGEDASGFAQDYPVAAVACKSPGCPGEQYIKLQTLHKLLIEPIADLLPKEPNQRVIIMPQEELFLVPFPALQDSAGKYLIEKHTLLTAPAIQVLQLTRKQRLSQVSGVRCQVLGDQRSGANPETCNLKSGTLIVGNPTMPTIPLSDPPKPLSALPGAEAEAIAIAKLFGVQPLIGRQATKVQVMQQIQDASLIHLATHGLLDDIKQLGTPGAIALAASGNDNGFLTSGEILDLKLKADLVVLSACNTGQGKLTGDGVIGLSRALMTAGVPSVLVSLWQVPDAPTADLMIQFYQNRQQRLNKAQALRQAMLTTMKAHPDPKNWAAFTLMGEAE